MMIALLLLTQLAVAPVAAPARDWKPYVSMIVGQSLDAASTQRFLVNGSGCIEANPRYGPHPTATRLWLGKAAVVGVLSLYLAMSERDSNKWVRRLPKLVAYYAAGQGAYSGVRNVYVCGW